MYAEELLIIPVKKPILDKITEEQKIIQGVIRPKPKPIKKVKSKQISQGIVKPIPKPNKEDEIIKKEIVKKIIQEIETTPKILVDDEKTKVGFLTPKSKPLVINKFTTKKQ